MTTMTQEPRATGVLGSTSGPIEGHVRAVIAIAATGFIHGIFILLLCLLVFRGAEYLRDMALSWGAALLAADVGYGAYYFGKRSGEGA